MTRFITNILKPPHGVLYNIYRLLLLVVYILVAYQNFTPYGYFITVGYVAVVTLVIPSYVVWWAGWKMPAMVWHHMRIIHGVVILYLLIAFIVATVAFCSWQVTKYQILLGILAIILPLIIEGFISWRWLKVRLPPICNENPLAESDILSHYASILMWVLYRLMLLLIYGFGIRSGFGSDRFFGYESGYMFFMMLWLPVVILSLARLWVTTQQWHIMRVIIGGALAYFVVAYMLVHMVVWPGSELNGMAFWISIIMLIIFSPLVVEGVMSYSWLRGYIKCHTEAK